MLHCRFLAIAGLVATAAFARSAQGQDGEWITARLESWYRTTARVAPGQWGIVIADQQGSFIWSVAPDEPLIPASTVKVLTTGYARSVLGSDARRATRVVGAGEIDSVTGAWIGNWALQLNGDISFGRGDDIRGPSLRNLADQLAQRGVKRLYGPLSVTSENGPAEALYPTMWASKHRGRLFAPLVGPLMFHENIIRVTIAAGSAPGQRARLVGAAPHGLGSLVTIQARTVSGRRARLSLRPRSDGGWVVGGTIGTRSRVRGLVATMRDPRRTLEAAWAVALADAGIAWQRQAPFGTASEEEPVALAEVQSAPFDSIASEVNRRSLNSGAELMLQWAAGPADGGAKLTAHVREVTGHMDDVYLVDGSGLSYQARVSPAAFIAYLAKYPQTPAGRSFPMLLPANGSGTLRRLGTAGFPGSGVVRAKTGTLGQVATVVGYLGRQDGVLLVSLMYNGRRPWTARQQQWRLFRLLGADGVVIPADSASAVGEEGFGGNTDAPPAEAAAPGDEISSEADDSIDVVFPAPTPTHGGLDIPR